MFIVQKVTYSLVSMCLHIIMFITSTASYIQFSFHVCVCLSLNPLVQLS